MKTTPDQLRQKLKGPVVAMTTHFTDKNTVDLPAMRKLTEYYVKSGIPAVIVTGSTGQFVSLTDEERASVQKAVIDQAAGRIAVIAGTSHSDTRTTIELTRKAEDLGADGVMITPPYGGYNGGGFDCLRAHYDTVTRQTKIGVVIYFSGNVLPLVPDILANPEKMLDLTEACNGHASGFKDASINFPFYRDVSLLLKDKVSVMGSAGMNYYFYGYQFGSPCFLTGLGNVWPSVEIEFYKHMVAENFAAARKIILDKEISYLRACMKTRRYWACLHALQGMVGLPGGPVRQPLLPISEKDASEIREVCKKSGLMDVPVVVPQVG